MVIAGMLKYIDLSHSKLCLIATKERFDLVVNKSCSACYHTEYRFEPWPTKRLYIIGLILLYIIYARFSCACAPCAAANPFFECFAWRVAMLYYTCVLFTFCSPGPLRPNI